MRDTINIMRTVVLRTLSRTYGNVVEAHCYFNDIKWGYL